MCGIAEAGLALSALSAVTGYMGQQQQAQADMDRQRRMDQAAYDKYRMNIKALRNRSGELKEEAGQKMFTQSIEQKRIEGKMRVHQGERGLGQFALMGISPQQSFNDLLFQAATGRARLQGEFDNRMEQVTLEKEAAYLNYKASNASFSNVMIPGFADPLLEIGQAGVKYMGNSNRKYFKDAKGTGELLQV
tara:strand:- start:1142 stop:1714 length:573 start_codon:yes stop_codon:yes gene_type:complete